MLINCVAYENGTRLAEIPVGEIHVYLARPGCFVWIALQDATPDELDTMQREFALHPLAIEDAHHGEQRPRVDEYGDSLFAVMHLVEYPETSGSDEPGLERLNVGELDVFVGPNYVVSMRARSRRSFANVRERCEREPHLLRNGAGFVFYALMDEAVDRYFPIIERFEDELEAIEKDIFDNGGARSNIKSLYGLKRRVTVLKHAVEPLAEGVWKLFTGRVPKLCEGSEHYFRDVGDHLARINTLLDGIRDTIATAISVNLSLVTIEDGEVTKRLAAWASIFAVLTAFAGIWGMNFEHMPELQWRFGYPAALLTMVTTCALLYRRFRRLGWL